MTNVYSLFGESSFSSRFFGQTYLDMIWDIPYSLGPDSFVEPDVHVHAPGPSWQISDLECPRGMILETHFLDALMHVDGEWLFSSPFFAGAIMPFLKAFILSAKQTQILLRTLKLSPPV